MKHQRRLGLARRFTLVFSLVILLVVGLLSVLGEAWMGRILNRQSELRARSLAISLSAVARPYLLTYDYLTLQRMADATIQEPDLAYVVILDKEGKVAGYGGHRDRQGIELTSLANVRAIQAEAPRTQRLTFPTAPGREGPVIECSAPVRVGGAGGERWGTVRVGLSLEPVVREMIVARVSLLLAVLCGMLAAVFASHALARRITRPLGLLVDAATEMERGRWNPAFSVRTGDEIEELTGRFARAAASLDRQKKELLAAKEELTALNATLEEKVQRRTAELAESREKYRLLVEGSPDAFLLLEQDRIVFANRAFLKIFQYPADSGVLENVLWTRVIHSDFHRVARDHIRRAEESLGDFHVELIGQTRAGRPVELEVRGRGVKFRGGTAVELVLADVGEKKRLLRQVVQHERLRAMGEMTTMVAHNFNNLLAVVLGRSQLLLRQSADSEVREGLEAIRTHAIRAGEMVRHLQDYFGEQVDLRFTEVDLNACVREVAAYLESLWQTMGEPGRPPVTIRLDLAPLPPVYGAEHLLQDVLRRVITNALEAMPEGGEIRIRTESDSSVVSVVVQDDGPGLTPEVQRRAFDPFFSTKGSQTRGLGLSTSFGIVQRHDGRIEIHPGPQQGTEVVMTLPAQTRGKRVVPFEAPAIVPFPGSAGDAAPGGAGDPVEEIPGSEPAVRPDRAGTDG